MLAPLLLLFFFCPAVSEARLLVKNGYFWDTDTSSFFIPRGFAYQVWNPPVFANQTLEELDRDLVAMKQAGANSLRVEFVWEGIESREGVFDWSRTDYLVKRAAELDLKLFVLIGYQYPPAWFAATYPDAMARTASGPAAIVNYNQPKGREAYARYLGAVCGHYRQSPAIAGWILGNEFAYYDLWEFSEQKNFAGFDSGWSLPAYRKFLADTYHNRISELNGAWGAAYADFSSVPMAASYPPDRNDHQGIRGSGYHDLIQWRKQSIAAFIAAGARAAKAASPAQLISYAMVGGIFSGLDSNYTAEDAAAIAASCRAAGAPLDFMSINNYAWALTGHEMRSVDFGIAKFRDTLDMPVLISETGNSSTETNFPGAAPRQGGALVGGVWESLFSGAAGVHVFHWNDRNGFLGGGYSREAGFGVVDQERHPKPMVFDAVTSMFRQMREIKVEELLPGSIRPRADVLVLWPTDIDLGWNRANEELASLWGALRRLGFAPRLINGETFNRFLDQGFPAEAKVLLLPRNFQMQPKHLAGLRTALKKGVHLHANGDPPGQFDARHRANPGWLKTMAEVFGIDAAAASIAWEAGAAPSGPWPAGFQSLTLSPAPEATLALPPAALSSFASWKIMRGIKGVPPGIVQASHGSGPGGQNVPGLITTTHRRAKTALTTFALGDIIPPQGLASPAPPTLPWDVRTAWLKTIYRDFFGLRPAVSLSGPGADYVLADVRQLANGVLLGLLNEHDRPAEVALNAAFLSGKTTVKDLLTGASLVISGAGINNLVLGPDEYRLFFIGE
ncbi:MAG: beta-galactosidase [Deltaproteobacteria bacterium]|nr:beta-galactosidase [Deltaproteobacteria bacterium]